MNKLILYYSLVILLFAAGYFLGYFLRPVFFSRYRDSSKNPLNESYTDVKEFSEDIIDYISIKYNYTPRSDIIRDDLDILDNGGDCYDWANMYVRWAEDKGFYGETPFLGVSTKSGHTFAVIYDDNLDYCILDGNQIVGCVKMK